MKPRTLILMIPAILFAALAMPAWLAAQVAGTSAMPYPNAVTDRAIHSKTPMYPLPVNTVFYDPDFYARMVRVSDETTNRFRLNGYLRTEGSGHSASWNRGTQKFYVMAEGGFPLAFGFDPTTMKITTLPGGGPGRGLALPLRPGPTFSYTDPDLIYGTSPKKPLTIISYRFSTSTVSTVLDTTTCATNPALSSTATSNSDTSSSADDSRFAIDEGGRQFGEHMFVIVYDKLNGCRWYNTQTGEIGGAWGPKGKATFGGYLIAHSKITENGKHVNISVNGDGHYFWDVDTLRVSHCPLHTSLICGGYGATGNEHWINGLGSPDEMNVGIRAIDDLAHVSPLVWPLVTPYRVGLELHFSWTNVGPLDQKPVCGSTYLYKEDYSSITRPFEDEVFCMETDLKASTIWRFAHTRASVELAYFNTQPIGSVSQDGRFYLFTSNWDDQVGQGANGTPRSDVWIVELR
jgi:hypothetical protein